jgi:hypothetical protein
MCEALRVVAARVEWEVPNRAADASKPLCSGGRSLQFIREINPWDAARDFITNRKGQNADMDSTDWRRMCAAPNPSVCAGHKSTRGAFCRNAGRYFAARIAERDWAGGFSGRTN